jgi:DNA-binding ferritin-like protein (Dps family)
MEDIFIIKLEPLMSDWTVYNKKTVKKLSKDVDSNINALQINLFNFSPSSSLLESNYLFNSSMKLSDCLIICIK